jgi:hypothetical protein
VRGISLRLLPLACASSVLLAAPALADGQSETTAASAGGQDSTEWDDYETDPAEPDFTVVNLPTALRLPRHKLAFRITHRFARPLSDGSFSDLLGDFFGFDGGAQIGLELRFAAFSGSQLGVYRTSDRTIELFAQQDIVQQGSSPVGVAAVGSVEGLDNFQQDYSPRLGVAVSRKLGTRGAFYAVPSWIGNTNLSETSEQDNSTLVLGLGARVRLSKTLAIVGEWTPRLAGYKGVRGGRTNSDHLTFGIEKRVGGHAFQINFSNDLGTTPAQTARGQQGVDDWFIGFNISRKFY